MTSHAKHYSRYSGKDITKTYTNSCSCRAYFLAGTDTKHANQHIVFLVVDAMKKRKLKKTNEVQDFRGPQGQVVCALAILNRGII